MSIKEKPLFIDIHRLKRIQTNYLRFEKYLVFIREKILENTAIRIIS